MSAPTDSVTLRVVAPASLPAYTVELMEQPGELVGRALVVVVDDRTAHGDEEDHSGPLVTELLGGEAGFVVDGVVVVSSDEVEIRNALNTAVIGGVDLVISVGGTGGVTRATSRLKPPATSSIANCSAFPRRCVPRACPQASSMPVFPAPCRDLRQHTRGEPRGGVPRGGARRHGHPGSAGGPGHRPALQPGNLTW